MRKRCVAQLNSLTMISLAYDCDRFYPADGVGATVAGTTNAATAGTTAAASLGTPSVLVYSQPRVCSSSCVPPACSCFPMMCDTELVVFSSLGGCQREFEEAFGRPDVLTRLGWNAYDILVVYMTRRVGGASVICCLDGVKFGWSWKVDRIDVGKARISGFVAWMRRC